MDRFIQVHRERPVSQQPSILIVDVGSESLAAMGLRLSQMGYHALRAKTTDQALESLADDRYEIGVVILPDDLPVFDLERSMAAFRERGGDRPPTLVASGSRPSADDRDRLRRTGVELALWNPVDDHTLRFQLNAALAHSSAGGLPPRSRRAQRVPTNWPIRVRTGARVKPAKIYSLSSNGAYLAIAAPSLPKAQVALTVPLPTEDLVLAGEVVMTNVPGNLTKGNLPIGMAIRFVGADEAQREALADYTVERAAQLLL